jgi:2-polyprenyl-3-methyl-5-hydroxy-6-metoxy-1,4-benzoquinol methylase
MIRLILNIICCVLVITEVRAAQKISSNDLDEIKNKKYRAADLMTGRELLQSRNLSFNDKTPLQNYALGMRVSQDISNIEGLPLYNWTGNWLNTPIDLRKWAALKNEDFNKEVFQYENQVILEIKKYNQWVGKRFVKEIMVGEEEFEYMLNDYGSASKKHCRLNVDNHILYLLHYYKPNKNIKILDIGSGWGACSKELALLGYTVYSVELDKRHIDYQKEHFCDNFQEDSFEYEYFKKNRPHLLNDQSFNHYCKGIFQQNIKYIEGKFEDINTLKEINSTDWDIVLALDTIQFMNKNTVDSFFKIIDTNLSKNGIFVIRTHYDYNDEEGIQTYKHYIEDIFEKSFSNYKILNIDSINQKLVGITLLKI